MFMCPFFSCYLQCFLILLYFYSAKDKHPSKEGLLKNLLIVSTSLVIGETADTLNALRYCKERGALIVGITNTGTI